MISQDLILHWLLTYRYFILFPITIFEGPIITMASGFLVSISVFNVYIALPIVIIGDVAGDVINYSIGYLAHRSKWAAWLMNKMGFEKHKEKVTESFAKHGGKILLFGKLTHALGLVFLTGAGYAKMPIGKFIWYNTLGTIIKSSALLGIGYLAGSAYQTYHTYFEYGSIILTIGSLLIVAAFYYFFHKITGIKKDEDLQ